MTRKRAFAWALLVVGIGFGALGGALVLNLLSLRELVEHTQLHPAIVAVFDVRDELSHRRAQWLELLSGFAGGGLVGLAIWLLRQPQRRQG